MARPTPRPSIAPCRMRCRSVTGGTCHGPRRPSATTA
jgi:hypothetical protein